MNEDGMLGAASGGSKLLAYLQLFRAPNVFTAMADVAMGFLFVRSTLQPLGPFACLLAASCLLYTAGMVLNDVYDYDVDARQRPGRPLPSGRISLRWARFLGYEFLLVGIVLGWCGGYLADPDAALRWRSGAVATLLGLCVVLYDAVLKKTPLGPLAMGACRFLNVLLGMSFGAAAQAPPALLAGWETVHLMAAGGIGVYIAGVTWFARTEAADSRRALLGWGLAVMVGGVLMLGSLPAVATPAFRDRLHVDVRLVGTIWPLALFLLMFPVLRRCLTAIANPRPQRVQGAVKQALLSLIVLDAAVCLLVSPWYFAVGVLALLVPTMILGKWVYST